jgi:hypothetical protein
MAAKSDQLFKRRKAPTKATLKRESAFEEPNKRILIVCEGEITEPSYFEAFKAFAKLVNVDVEVCGRECDSAPISVVNFAEKRANSQGPHTAGGYDEVYCVFDRDTHTTFDKAISKVLTLERSSNFLSKHIEAVPSYPCFEVWLLYHFTLTRAPGDMAVAALKKASPLFSNYDKSFSQEQFNCLFKLIDVAISNAEKASDDNKETGEPNPSTTIHKMLKKLQQANIKGRATP